MPSSLGIGVATLFFLLIPGFASLKTALNASNQLDDWTRIDKIVWSIMAGGMLLFIVLVVANWKCWTGNVAGFVLNPRPPAYSTWTDPTAWCSNGDVVTLDTLKSIPFVMLGVFVGLQTALGIGAGWVCGRGYNLLSDGPTRGQKDVEQPWEFASRKVAREKDRATVITVSGDEIKGTIYRVGAPSEDYDILLRGPKRVIRDGDNETKVRRLAPFSYHHYRDISQIHFHDMMERDLEVEVDRVEDDDWKARLANQAERLASHIEAVADWLRK